MITRILRIKAHPISKYADNLKESYVRGLGHILYSISNNHPYMRLLFEQWGYSILHQDVSMWFNSNDSKVVGEALSLHRQGFIFFRVKRQFYFDCFYLTESFNSSLLPELNTFLLKHGCNIFTKTALRDTVSYFVNTTSEIKVEDELKQHRHRNKVFRQQPEYRVLVVATVSAGKSTLINALIGHNFNRAKNGVCTTRICRIHNKPEHDGITFRNKSGLTYDSEIDIHSSDDIFGAAFHFESSLGDKRICFIDTPGVNNSRDSGHFHITSDAIKSNNYDLVLFISNGQYNGTNDERHLLELVHSSTRKPVLFVLNQLDTFKSGTDDIGKMIVDYANELNLIGYTTPKILPVSAKFAKLLRMEDSLDEDELDELSYERRKFRKPFYDFHRFNGTKSSNEIECSGIIQIEQEIKKKLKYQ